MSKSNGEGQEIAGLGRHLIRYPIGEPLIGRETEAFAIELQRHLGQKSHGKVADGCLLPVGQFGGESDRFGTKHTGGNRHDAGFGADRAGRRFDQNALAAPVYAGCRSHESNGKSGAHAGDQCPVALLDYVVGFDVAIGPNV